MEKKIIIANWKMNPGAVAEAQALAKKIERATARQGASGRAEVVIAPPAVFLVPVARVLSRVALGAQNAFWEDAGPYTGEVSPAELKSVGVRYVIVAHSERKANLGETDEMIAKKIAAVTRAGMTAILCIGERHREGADIPAEVGLQVKSALSGLKKKFLRNLIVCYEPVWAISTASGARPAEPDDAFRAAVYIRKIVGGIFGPAAGREARVIYGGSVTAKNIASFIGAGGMGGALVGAASLNEKEFSEIIRSAAGVARR